MRKHFADSPYIREQRKLVGILPRGVVERVESSGRRAACVVYKSKDRSVFRDRDLYKFFDVFRVRYASAEIGGLFPSLRKNVFLRLFKLLFKRAEEHKKALTAYIQAAYDISGNIYQTADACYPTGCGSAGNVIGKDTAARKARTIVEDYIRALKAQAN